MNKPNIVYPDSDDDTAKIFSGELGLRLKKLEILNFSMGSQLVPPSLKVVYAMLMQLS